MIRDAVAASNRKPVCYTPARRNSVPMRQFRYHGNFCTECGNPLTQRRRGLLQSWRQRVFCDECAVQLRYRQRLPGQGWPWLLLLAATGFFYLFKQPAAPPAIAPMAAQSLTTAPVIATTSLPEAEPRFCGARTRKGTPCRRLVKIVGQHCAQHRRQPVPAPSPAVP